MKGEKDKVFKLHHGASITGLEKVLYAGILVTFIFGSQVLAGQKVNPATNQE